MKNIQWLETNQIQIDPVSKPKKITGTRFSSILKLNPWETPFQTWCQMTRVYQPPFEDNIYTIAGKTIEPKIINYLKLLYFGEHNVITPTDVYGENYFEKTYGDFYKENKVLGGMWDCLLKVDGVLKGVIEIKTTKRVEDWKDEAPLYYTQQAGLYAKLLGLDTFYMVVAFLEDKDYENPQEFKPNSENVLVKEYSLSRDFPNFEYSIECALDFYKKHILTGISPMFDEKKDAEYLKALRTATVDSDEAIETVIEELEQLQDEISEQEVLLKPKIDRLERLKKNVKETMQKAIGDGETHSTLQGLKYSYELSKSFKKTANYGAIEKDGLTNLYVKETPVFTLRVRKEK